MNIALLFDGSNPVLGFDYGSAVLRLILRTGVLQRRRAHVRVSTGDILTRMLAPTWSLSQVLGSVYTPIGFDRLRTEPLRKAVDRSTVFCWLLQNLAEDAADELNSALSSAPGYLGAMGVSFARPVQLAFFREYLPEYFRFRGSTAAVLYTGHNEDPDLALEELLVGEDMTVSYEDIGARKTAFDRFTDPAHFQRIEYFLEVAHKIDGTTPSMLSELAMVTEEIHPLLFDVLKAAMQALDTAQTDEDLAQAALSGRRFLEALANYWFPARDGLLNGRKVGPTEYRNRMWAYLTDAAGAASPPASDKVAALGATLDDLIKEFNAGLHAAIGRARLERAFSALLIWLSDAVSLNPDAAARPYLAYGPELERYMSALAQEVLDRANEA